MGTDIWATAERQRKPARLIDPGEYWGWPNGVAVATQVSKQADRLADSYDHFFETATVDLLNTGHAVVGGTFIGGIHTAACAGTYQLAVQGFGGLDVQGDTLIVRPKLPTQWTRLTYPVAWRGNHLVVTAGHDAVTVTADEGNAVGTAVTIGSDTFMIEPGQSVKVVLLGA